MQTELFTSTDSQVSYGRLAIDGGVLAGAGEHPHRLCGLCGLYQAPGRLRNRSLQRIC
jgi:hypothetical protein